MGLGMTLQGLEKEEAGKNCTICITSNHGHSFHCAGLSSFKVGHYTLCHLYSCIQKVCIRCAPIIVKQQHWLLI